MTQLDNELRTLQAAAPVEHKAPGIVDRGLIQQRKALIAERDKVAQAFRQSGGSRNDLLVTHDRLSRRIAELSRQISAQQNA